MKLKATAFLITSLLIAEHAREGRIALGAFYARRVARIFPASYLYIAVVAALALAGVAQVSATQFGVAALQMQNYAAVLFTLGLVDRISDLANATHDTVGRELEEEQLPERIRLSRPRKQPKPPKASDPFSAW